MDIEEKSKHDLDYIVATIGGAKIKFVCDMLIYNHVVFRRDYYMEYKRYFKDDLCALVLSCLYARMSLKDRLEIRETNDMFFNLVRMESFVSAVNNLIDKLLETNESLEKGYEAIKEKLLTHTSSPYGLIPFAVLVDRTDCDIRELILNKHGGFIRTQDEKYYTISNIQMNYPGIQGFNYKIIGKEDYLKECTYPKYRYGLIPRYANLVRESEYEDYTWE